MTTGDGLLAFLSWTRAGLAAAASPDPLSGPLPAAAAISLGYQVNARPARSLTARLYGPGDVTALDERQVIRTDPRPGDDTFPPHLFPLVEFDLPDLPWLLTPAAPADRDRLRPWLVLVVVEADHARLVAGGALPALETRLDQLPDLAASHLWAHAQVALDGPPEDGRIDDLLARAPGRTLSRLVCPRRLHPRRSYLACVVPAFEAGRRTGLGLAPDAADSTTLRPAWTAGTGPAPLLPVLHHWEFATGDAGSFEALADRLQGRPLPRTVGIRDVDLSRPGGGLPEQPPGSAGATLELEGALRSTATVAQAWDPAARAAFEAALRPRLEPGAPDTPDVTPPVYGLTHSGRTAFQGDADRMPWLAQLNLDPRHRAVAALGTRAVQDNQEDLVAAAWDQVAALREVNQTLRQGQLGRTVAQAAYDRRIDQDRPGTPLPDDRLLQVTFPVHRMLGPGTAPAAAQGLRATTTPAFRKATRPGRPLARLGGAEVSRPMTRLAALDLTVLPPLPVPPGLAAPERLSPTETMRDLLGERVVLPSWAGPPQGPTEAPVPAEPRAAATGAPMPGRVFVTTTDGRMMSRVTQGVISSWQDHGRPPGTTAAGSPCAVRDLYVYVVGADRQVWELAWNGDCWNWRQLPLPGGLQVAAGGEPWATWADSRPIAGGFAQTGTFDMVWTVGSDGNLWQLPNRQAGWVNRGSPAGESLSGKPGSRNAWSILVPATSARLWGFAVDEQSGAWQWTQVGGLQTPPLGTDRPFTAVLWTYLAGQNPNELWQFGLTLGGGGLPVPVNTWVRVRTDLGSVLGTTPQGVLVSTTSGAVMLGRPGLLPTTWEQYLPAPPGFTPGAVLRGVVRADGTVLTAIGGRYLEGATGGWSDLGAPRVPGAGDPGAAPAQHRRWRPVLGLMSDLLVCHVDAAAGGDRLHVRTGADVGFDAEVRGGWELRDPMPDAIGSNTQGMGVALADVRGRGGDAPRRDLVALWVQDFGDGHFPHYRVGFDLGADGRPGSWSPVRRCPTPVSTSITSGGGLTLDVPVQDTDVDVVDLDGDGRPELVMAYVTAAAAPSAYYRIGWSLDADGSAAQGWSESQRLPAPPGPVVGIGVTVADLSGDLRPDLVVLYVCRVAGVLQATYRIGWGLNARGMVAGGWSNPFPVGGGPLPAALQGVSLTSADFSGSERPDLLVLLVENGPTDNVGRYRIGWDVRGAARSWSDDRPVGGWFGWESRGAGIAVGDLEPSLLARKQAFARAFTDASKVHQTALAAAQRRALPADPAVALTATADSARVALRPAQRIEQRVGDRIDGIDLTVVGADDRLAPLLAAPSFDMPAYELVRDIAREYLLPGVEAVPPDTVSLLRASPAFIEAFMVGLNHELGRELLWRGLPADRTATSFRRFWDRSDGAADIPPISSWGAGAVLGGSAAGVGGPDMAVLVVRGELLRRHPNTIVSAIRAEPAPDGSRRLGSTRLEPAFRGSIDPDITFFGFTLTVAQARGSDADPGWFFAFAEHPTEPRFGLDEAPENPVYGTPPAAWNNLDWAAVVPDRARFDAITHVPAQLPFPRDTELPVRDDRTGADRFRWAENSAHVAHITLQRPVLLAIHASDLLGHESGEFHITHVVRERRVVTAVAGRFPDGRWWRLSVSQAAAAIRRHERLFVQPDGEPAAEVTVVRGRGGREYLRTRAGDGTANNLLSLPDLPADADV